MISDVRLRNFRSFKSGSFEFEDGVNIIVGPNASGKTNLLEAILVACRGKSFRSPDGELIRFDMSWATVHARGDNLDRSVKIKQKPGGVEKTISVNGNNHKRIKLENTFPAVVFEPKHMQLLTGVPSLRRGFIDDILEHTKPDYQSTRNKYKRALGQRNALLKTNFSQDQMFVWDVRLSELGGVIINERREFIKNNQKRLEVTYSRLAGKPYQASLNYLSKLPEKTTPGRLLKNLQSNLQQDKERGFTLIGPHRDDIMPILNGRNITIAGSRGETRTMLLALKLLEMEAIESARGIKPLLLLDDVFSELDGRRRQALTSYLKGHQTFITTTDADVVTKQFTKTTNLIAL